MILIDSSVWIDYFRGNSTPKTERLDALLIEGPVAVADLVLAEVLQGCVQEKEFRRQLALMGRFPMIEVAGLDIAIQAARNYRFLRAKGITIRKTIDTLIATRCIMDGHTLLYSDRDFDPFVEHLGLISAMRPN